MYKEINSNKRKSLALLLIFIIVITALAYLYELYYGGGTYITFFAIIIASTMSLVSFYAGDKLALKQAGAQKIERKDNPYIYRMVENLAITAGLAKPQIYLIKDPHMNAFATGRDPEHASLALTTGLINNLENEELEGVIAHEMSHIKNYDIRLMMVVITCVGIITLLADIMLRSFIFRRRGNNNKANGFIIIIGLLLAIFSPLFAKLIQLAISRKREFLADASGALLTRYPEGLARALEKIKRQKAPLAKANKATAHLYFANPFQAQGIKKAFSTHPPIAERIISLRNM